MSTLSLLGSFAIVGVVVSAVIEYTKNIFTEATPGKRTIYMLALSVAGGLIVFFFHLIPANVLADIVGVIAAVNSAYVFLVQYLPNAPISPSATQ